MNVLIVEDEIRNFTRLKKMLASVTPEAQVHGPIESVAQLTETLQEGKPYDVILCDVQLSDGVCFDALAKVPEHAPVIFTTAYDEYALQAFKHSGVDYLLKPVSMEELKMAMAKITARSASSDLSALLSIVQQNEAPKYRERFLVPSVSGYNLLFTADTEFFVLEDRTVYAHTLTDVFALSDVSLDDLEAELDPATFFRANRQYIVSLQAIRSLENYFGGKLVVKLRHAHNDTIVVSREKAPIIKKWLAQ